MAAVMDEGNVAWRPRGPNAEEEAVIGSARASSRRFEGGNRREEERAQQVE